MTYTNIVLDTIGVKSFTELGELDTAEVIQRVDERKTPLHPGDAFLGVLVLRGIGELQRSTERLDRASRRYEIAGLLLAVVAVGVALAQLVAAL
jgi:hypothetical protein